MKPRDTKRESEGERQREKERGKEGEKREKCKVTKAEAVQLKRRHTV